jgi:hypothetical protein
MDDFQKILNKEVEQLNKNYDNEIAWEQQYGKGSIQKWRSEYIHPIFPFGLDSSSTEKSCICLISDDKNDYIVDDKIYNKCSLYIPSYSIFEGEHVQFPSALLNFKIYESEKRFIEKFGLDTIKELYCFGILETDSTEKHKFLYKILQQYIENHFMKVPGIFGKDFYMIDCKNIENWCHYTFHELYKNIYINVF